MHSFVKDIFLFDVPFIEDTDETLLVCSRNAVHQLQQLPGGLYLRVLSEMPANNEHLVELAHLYAERLQSLW